MKLSLIAFVFAVGSYLPWALPLVLPAWSLLLMVAVGTGLAFTGRGVLMIACLAGFGYGQLAVLATQHHQLPLQPQSIDLRVEGQVVDLPDVEPNRQRFLFEIDHIEPLGSAPLEEVEPRLVRLSWYYGERVQPGQTWTFEVRLRRPRGLANPGGFDYRRWLLSQGIDATGYVRDVIASEPAPAGGVDGWRSRQRRAIQDEADLSYSHFIAALGIGDRSGIAAEEWQLFQRTGVIHLMVISGLHVGFAAWLGYWLAALLLRPLILLHSGWSAQDLAWTGAIVAAVGYALCAGLSLPTLRAALMVTVLAVSRLLRLEWSVWTVLAVALALIALWQPTAPLAEGFWMSFGAVVVLVAAFQGRRRGRRWLELGMAQLALFVGFSAIPLVFGKPVPLIAPVVNLVAVPFTGLLVVPAVLAGLVLEPLSATLSQWCWQLADFALHLLHQGLNWADSLPLPLIKATELPLSAGLAMLASGLALVALPLRWPLRLLLALAFLPLLLDLNPRPFLQMRVFDVGQGTAILLRQPGYALLYDTGPDFSPAFNPGRDVIRPVLEDFEGDLDLIVSHGDNDHAGGLAAIAPLVSGRLLSGEPLAEGAGQRCRAGQQWQVGQVSYRILHPADGFRGGDDNDRSCVLLVSFAGRHLLLPGDIGARAEAQLLASDLAPRPLDVLMVPHHGSKTSSTPAFVKAFQSNYALVSSGYGNRFGHPAPEVTARYAKAGTELLNTALAGAIDIVWTEPEASPEVSSVRQSRWFWWQD